METEITITRELADYLIVAASKNDSQFETIIQKSFNRWKIGEAESFEELKIKVSELDNDKIEYLLLKIS